MTTLHFLNPDGTRRGYIRWPDGHPPAPFGCRWCGCSYSVHGWIFIPARHHTWKPPTAVQVKARLEAHQKHNGGTK